MALASPLLEKEEQAYVAVGDHIAAQDIDGPRFPGCHGRRPLVVFGLATVLVIAASSNPFVVSGQLNQLSTVEGCDASLMESNALAFFWALNSGEDWKGTMPYVSDEQATFNAQVTDGIFFVPPPVVSNTTTIAGFAEWMMKLVTIETWGLCGAPINFINASATDPAAGKVLIFSLFEFAYWVDVLTFDMQTCKIVDMKKVWNDGWTIANDPGPPPGCEADEGDFPTFTALTAASAVASRPSSLVAKQQGRTLSLSSGCTAQQMEASAMAFFEACESGMGWTGTKAYVSSEQATFHADVTDALPGPPLSSVSTIQGYTEWMAGVVEEFGAAATFSVKAKGLDEARRTMIFYAVFGGFSEYVYTLTFDAQTCKINQMVKIWNDGAAVAAIASGAGR